MRKGREYKHEEEERERKRKSKKLGRPRKFTYRRTLGNTVKVGRGSAGNDLTPFSSRGKGREKGNGKDEGDRNEKGV